MIGDLRELAAATFVAEDHISLMGVPVLNVTMRQAIEHIDLAVRGKTRAKYFFANACSLNIAWSDRHFFSILHAADGVFGDGVGVRIASKFLGTPIVANVNGTDMFPQLCRLCEEKGYSIYFLGAKPGVVERMTERLLQKFPGLNIAGHHHGYFDTRRDSTHIIDRINRSNADVLLVAMGVPAQEKWIHSHREQLACSVCLGVGGLFDFFSGDIPRAPLWMRRHGLEWFFRLMCEPRRLWKRYLWGNPLFLMRLLESRIALPAEERSDVEEQTAFFKLTFSPRSVAVVHQAVERTEAEVSRRG